VNTQGDSLIDDSDAQILLIADRKQPARNNIPRLLYNVANALVMLRSYTILNQWLHCTT